MGLQSEDENRAIARRAWAGLASRVARVQSDLAMMAIDAVLVVAAVVLMMLLRFDGSVPEKSWTQLSVFLPVAVAVTLFSNHRWGLYGKIWRHASMYEASRLIASGLSVTVILTVAELAPRHVPISVAFVSPIIATFLMSLVRFQSRLFSYRRAGGDQGLKVVVIGSGDAGASLVSDMLRSPRAGFRPVAVLDEDEQHHGRSFMGVEVLGGIDDLPRVIDMTGAHLVVFAMSNAPQELVRRAAQRAEEANVALKIVPGISTSMRGGVSLRDLRDVRIEDLLGRDQIATDLAAVRSMLAGRRVIVTGAGGSIGSEIARQVHSFGPEAVILLDHDETHLHEVAADLDRAEAGDFVQVLADIRNLTQLRKVFTEHRPSVVFHAAAHKHVPLLEAHPTEAVATNVIGTSNVLTAAEEAGVERLVFVSTDKAVYPSSVMGASKRIGEQLVISRAPIGAAYCAVRFGNVLGSRGSVVPTFVRQIDSGGPVTVTDRRMTRYFMSIEEAVQLVLQAATMVKTRTNGEGGSVFMLDMGEPVVIYDLAERMIRLSGRQPGTDIEIKITGIRPGEKLAEELRALDEAEEPTDHPSVRRVTPIEIDPRQLERGVLDLELKAIELDDAACDSALRALASVDHDPTPFRGIAQPTEHGRRSS